MAGSRQKLDLTGQRFGHLTVLAPAENIGTRTAWRCRCDCGQDIVVPTRDLRRGRRTSCGCDAKPSGCNTKLSGCNTKPSDNHPSAIGRASLTYVDGTCIEMIRSKTIRRNNTSGVPGVDWWASKGLWRATICFKGKRYYLGGYHEFEEAVKARKRAEEELYDKFLEKFSQCPGR